MIPSKSQRQDVTSLVLLKAFNLPFQDDLCWRETVCFSGKKCQPHITSKFKVQVDGRIAQVANSHTGSRVLQACAKHGSPKQRLSMLAEIMPQLLDLSKSPYAHFLVCKLIATIPRPELKGRLSSGLASQPTHLDLRSSSHINMSALQGLSVRKF